MRPDGRRSSALVVGLAAALAFVCSGGTASAELLAVSVDRATVSTQRGQELVFRSAVENRGDRTASGLVVHVDVVSLRNDAYVDPEDWSSSRTRYLAPLRAGAKQVLTWKLRAVNEGMFAAYVAVLSAEGPARPPATTSSVLVQVAGRRTLNAGGILPLAFGVPGALGLLALLVWQRRRTASA